MQKVIVTGGAGFIGSHLVEKLLKRNNEVIVIDNFSTGKYKNLPKNKNLKLIKANVVGDVNKYFKGVDTVFHLAALTRPQESIIHPRKTTKVNVLGTLRILEHCRDNKIKRLVYTSTTGIYGEQKKLPIKESATPMPMSPYALTKLIGEHYCKLFQTMYGLEFNAIRPFNVYGPRQDPKGTYGAAVPKFINSLGNNKRPFITGDGTQARDFVYVDDVVELMILLAKTPLHGEAFNAGSGVKTSIKDLYTTISKLMNKDIKPKFIDPVFEPKYTLGDMTKAKNLLGFSSKYNLLEGLTKTINYKYV